jgi:hypothetical protein
VSKKRVLDRYLQALAEVAAPGDASEESYYSCLTDLLKAVAIATGRADVHVTPLPKKAEAGNPDFRLWNGTDRVIGYIEAKAPTQENLDHIEQTEQLRRYRETFPNLILTNFLEFRLYRDGHPADSVLAGRPFILTGVHRAPPLEKADELWALLQRFLDFSVPKATSAEELATQLATRTRFLKDVVAEQVAEEQAGRGGMLLGFYEAFCKFLIADLTADDFADLYAQTITYGLFAARVRAQNGFGRRTAIHSIPRTIGILRDLFQFISLGDLPKQLEWIVDDIAEVLAVADAPGILARYYRDGKGRDPIVPFYETFLAIYDPEERERRGVYYTPEPVVSYIVRSLHKLLQSEFGLPDGLASKGVTLLDPAAGTMTFVARAAQEAMREFESKYGAGARQEFIHDHILPHFYAFELMMAPYAVGHLKMSFVLEELGHRLADDERVQFYLTNTLEMEELEQSRLPGFASLAEESHLAGEVKRQEILVILGNPPYSGHSSNRSWELRDGRRALTWIGEEIEDYKQVDGQPLGEKNPKWLQDDYVKFLRFAEWKMAQAQRGVVGMITNHSYLDNPTFRGMRRHLMRTFDEIRVLDLHGNALKREVCPDGSPDENVFDIRQGVAIAFFVKRGQKRTESTVRHSERWGLRQDKYSWLQDHNAQSTSWQELRPGPPSYLFVPRDDALDARYQAFAAVPDLFPVHSVGIVTARDALAIRWTPDEVWHTVNVFSRMDSELAREAYNLGKDARDWKIVFAQQDLLDSGPARENVVPILYRPFDVRYTYYTGRSRGFLCMPRPEVMRHMLQDNLALLTPRRVEHAGAWQHTFVCTMVSDHVSVSLKTIDYHFPLYLYPVKESRELFAPLQRDQRQPNVNAELFRALSLAHGREPAAADVFQYVYAVLNTPTYRHRYSDFLRRDFPRVPFTADADLFAEVAALGARLTQLHLLRSPELDPPACRFEVEGDGRVGRGKALRYDGGQRRVYVNATQYFAPVPPEVWVYPIGGYQVCHKWLKDRHDRCLELDDIRTYCRVVTALERTIAIQEELDELYPKIEENLLAVSAGSATGADSKGG